MSQVCTRKGVLCAECPPPPSSLLLPTKEEGVLCAGCCLSSPVFTTMRTVLSLLSHSAERPTIQLSEVHTNSDVPLFTLLLPEQ